MNTANFSLEFQLNVSEIKMLNDMYFKHLFKDRIVFGLLIVLSLMILIDFSLEIDYLDWLIRSLLLVVFFVMIQFSLIDVISKAIFKLTKKIIGLNKSSNKYKLSFTHSNICVKSPLGELTHKWSKIEKVIQTKNFLFLYIKEQNSYIISISKKESNSKKIEELLSFVEKNVIHVVKV
ncbi:YcxB family protein [Flavobacterium sp. IB48]|uniref:YcxB family protein n=1 Tax=Flavobacterium sp. IB48 TaxID=2779375 RepID=UPI0018E880E7|nr:YcxB family protein [Flavobacterium sp. IB48]MBJ2126149.1 YcxB family protein [Flavobacterium sp. IB48]